MSTTTLDTPIRVKELNTKIGAWISRLGHIHVEGQVTQINRRPGAHTAFLTLRDPQAAASVSVTASPGKIPAELTDGDSVVVFGKPSFWQGRGNLSLRASEIHQVGEGDLLRRIALFRQSLAGEGALRPELKKRLPMLPRRIGLITGAESAAERDVLSVAKQRWAAADFCVINTPVQGPSTSREVARAIKALDDQDDIDVIIIARGGGSVEDLLPFSSEQIIRAVMMCETPVISAIGHEPDNPVLDDVADFRAATPTDAAKNVVPDAMVEVAGLLTVGESLASAFARNVEREVTGLHSMEARVNGLGGQILARERSTFNGWRSQFDLTMAHSLQSERNSLLSFSNAIRYANPGSRIENEYVAIAALGDHLEAVSPKAVMERGFAIVTNARTGDVITTGSQISGGTSLTITFADGSTRDVMALALPHSSVGIKQPEGTEAQ
ncbi:exonuclease [Gordonia phage Daredevil]|uniref:Uncharacterized protein n=1 Tax=Gordonia phage Daredevil TaxID=2283286 RepID=A0A345MIP9_9CAUD|nr:exonuclease [Gordonia phage Daredevil]AXH70430.1 hypothetical protein SEA_DAREDEVIL_43 [Gordonia phage Daredevil]